MSVKMFEKGMSCDEFLLPLQSHVKIIAHFCGRDSEISFYLDDSDQVFNFRHLFSVDKVNYAFRIADNSVVLS